MPLPATGKRSPGASPSRILASVFGFEAFRGVQADAVAAIVSGRDALVVMPTSGGKSLCFQVPALCLPGLCVVVSPLLALMRDQCDQLRLKGVRAAALVSNQSQGFDERRVVEAALAEGSLDILYVSPERFTSRAFAATLARSPVSVVAIDEAHCVSEWGQDFRKEYLEVAKVLDERLPGAVRVALTASAAPGARDDIVTRLLRRAPARFVSSFGRDNISLSVTPSRDAISECVDGVPRNGVPTIVYCRTRKDTEEIATRLRASGFAGACAYHAGMEDGDRARVQDGFLKNDVPVIAATSAFGMGIDKPDVGMILHAGLPSGLEAYYQESGRAGRDGRAATGRLVWTAADVGRRTALASSLEPSMRAREIARVEQVMSYVETPGCRINVLLRRFGERPTGPCGRCDTCLTPPPLRDGSDEVHAIVGLLRRLGDTGISATCEILVGASTARVVEGGYANVPGFGLLKRMGTSGVRRTIRQLAGLGLLDVDDVTARIRPTEDGIGAVDQGLRVSLLDETLRPRRVAMLEGIPEGRVALWEGLVKARRDHATALGLPAYAVASDADLAAIVAGGSRPLDEAFLREIAPLVDARTPPAMPAAFQTSFF